jgi:hypothetical protein
MPFVRACWYIIVLTGSTRFLLSIINLFKSSWAKGGKVGGLGNLFGFGVKYEAICFADEDSRKIRVSGVEE